MASRVVQFREEEAAIEYLRSKGINPNEFGHEAFERALRRLRAEEWVAKLEKLQLRLGASPEQIIRELRDSH